MDHPFFELEKEKRYNSNISLYGGELSHLTLASFYNISKSGVATKYRKIRDKIELLSGMGVLGGDFDEKKTQIQSYESCSDLF